MDNHLAMLQETKTTQIETRTYAVSYNTAPLSIQQSRGIKYCSDRLFYNLFWLYLHKNGTEAQWTHAKTGSVSLAAASLPTASLPTVILAT